MIGIYKITNKLNNKSYIGQSIDINVRWKNHISNSTQKNNPCYEYPLYKAFRKYGLENFKFEILKICKRKDLLKYERYYYDKYSPEYNQMYPNPNPVFDLKIEEKRQAIFKTEEYRRKCSKKLSQDAKNKISLSLRNSERFKKSHNTKEYKEKMKVIRNKGLRADKPVIMYSCDFEKEFESMSACAKWLDTNTKYNSKNKVSKIKAVCDGERHSAFGYKYKYKQSQTTISKESTIAIDTQSEAAST